MPMPKPLMRTIAVLEPDIGGLAEGELKPGTTGVRLVKAFGDTYVGPRPHPRSRAASLPLPGARCVDGHLRALTCALAGRASVGEMARKQMNSKQEAGWLWLPLIIGLIIGATVAATTDQWWWSTVGVLGGAAFGWVSYARMR